MPKFTDSARLSEVPNEPPKPQGRRRFTDSAGLSTPGRFTDSAHLEDEEESSYLPLALRVLPPLAAGIGLAATGVGAVPAAGLLLAAGMGGEAAGELAEGRKVSELNPLAIGFEGVASLPFFGGKAGTTAVRTGVKRMAEAAGFAGASDPVRAGLERLWTGNEDIPIIDPARAATSMAMAGAFGGAVGLGELPFGRWLARKYPERFKGVPPEPSPDQPLPPVGAEEIAAERLPFDLEPSPQGPLPRGPVTEGVPPGPERLPNMPGGAQGTLLDAQGQPVGAKPRPGKIVPPEPLERPRGGVFDEEPDPSKVEYEQARGGVYDPIDPREVRVFRLSRPTETVAHRLRVVPIDSLLTNSDIQTRTRTRNVTSDVQISKIAEDPSAARYLAGMEDMNFGPAIIGPDMKVESGNGRILGLLLARRKNPAGWAKFQAEQRELAKRYGLRPEDFDGIADPVMVRERTQPMTYQERLAWVDEANTPPSLTMGTAETGTRDLRLMSDDVVSRFEVEGGESLDEAIRHPRNREVVRGFFETLNPNEIGRMVTRDGKDLNRAGVERIRTALLSKVLRGERGQQVMQSMAESIDTNVKTVETAIFRALPKYLKAYPVLKAMPELDISENISEAVTLLSQLRKGGWKLNDFLLQIEAKGARDPATIELLKHFWGKNSPKAISALDNYADLLLDLPQEASAPSGALPGMGRPVGIRTKSEMLKRAIEGPQGDTLPFDQPDERGSFEAGGIFEFFRHPFARMKAGAERVRAAQMEEVINRRREQAQGAMPSIAELQEAQGMPTRGNAPGYNVGEDLQAPGFGRDTSQLQPSTRIVDEGGIAEFQRQLALKNRATIDQARRGVVSDRQVRMRAEMTAQAFREQLGIDMTEAINSMRMTGEAMNAEGLETIAMTAHGMWEDMLMAGARGIRQGVPLNENVEFLRLFTGYRAVLPQQAGAAAEAGRAFRILRQIKAQQGSRKAQFDAMAREQGLTPEVMAEMQRILLQIGPDDPKAAHAFLQGAQKATTMDKLREFYINVGLLSGLKTLLVQFPSQMSVAAAEYPVRALSPVIDVARAKLTGTPQERFKGEATEALFAVVRGFKSAAKSGLTTFVSEIGDPKFAGLQGLEFESRGRPKQAIPGLHGYLARTPGRALSGQDDFLLNLEYNAQIGTRLARLAWSRGIPDEQVPQWVNRAMQKMPNLIHSRRGQDAVFKQIHETSISEARRINAKREPGEITRAVNNLRSTLGPLGWIVAPFTNTPSNLMHMGYRLLRSPFTLLQLLKEGSARGGDWSEDVARAVLGTAFMGTVAAAYEAGILTGGGPRDPRERDVWRRATGQEPYSGRWGEQMISYQRLDPAAITVGVITDGLDAFHHLDPAAFGSAVLGLLANNMLQKTYALNIENFSKFIDDPDRYGTTWASKTIGPMVVPSFINQAARAQDPYMRRPQTIGESIGLRLPEKPPLRQIFQQISEAAGYPVDLNIPPIRDVFGEPIELVGSTIERMTNPFTRVDVRDTDPVYAELHKVKYVPQGARNTLGLRVKGLSGKIELTRHEIDMYEAIGGRLARKSIERIIDTPAYQGLADNQKRYVIQQQFRKAHDTAADVVVAKIRPRALREGRVRDVKRSGELPPPVTLP